MIQLTYTSLASANFGMSDIQEIMRKAEKFNGENEITGCLLLYNRRFIQILEGEKEIIENLYSKIKQDKKHSNVNLLGTNETSTRIFPKWVMAFKEINDSQLGQLTGTLFEENLIGFSEITKKPTLATRVFWEKVVEVIKIQKIIPLNISLN
ncbi:MAG: hypothetical protein ACJAYY_001998 [Paraglaciecola sp.]|jgi:hypothetical protein